MKEQTAASSTAKEPRLYGVIDVLRSDRVAGWVIDRTDAARCATVEIRREGRLIGTVSANRLRKDLERQAVGTGAYGFAFNFEPPLEDGMEFTVALTAKSHDGVELPLQTTVRAAAQFSAEKRALGRILAELVELRDDIGKLRQEMVSGEAGRTELQGRLELVQLRLESEISAVEAPERETSRWLAGIAVTGAVIALGSLSVALFSL